MAFTTAMPAFASDVSYYALGDSIAAGTKNLDHIINLPEVDNPGFRNFLKFKNGVKNTDVYAVPNSFVYRIATAIDANEETSFNGAFEGARAKNLCEIFGLPVYPGDSYCKDLYTRAQDLCSGMGYTKILKKVNVKLYKEGLKRANIITIECGENDIAAFIADNYDEVICAVAKSMLKVKGSVAMIARFAEDYISMSQLVAKGQDASSAKAKVAEDVLNMKNKGLDTEVLEQSINDVIYRQVKINEYYLETLIEYIREVNPDAKLAISTVVNPYKDAHFGSMQAAQVVIDTMGTFAQRGINEMNRFLMDNSEKYGYVVADITAISLNPPKDENGASYLFHPNGQGQESIKDAFLSAIE